MKIEEIDKNFQIEKADADGLTRYAIPHPAFRLYGIFHNGKQFVRMPSSVAKEVSEGVFWLHGNTAGGRLRFSTDSERIEIDAKWPSLCAMSHMPLSGSGGFALIDETEDEQVCAGGYFPAYTEEFQTGLRLCKQVNPSRRMRDYTLYFPLYNDVSALTIGLDEWAQVGGGKRYRDKKPFLCYGSSITQGGCASRADKSYQAILTQWSGVDHINLGFSGNGKGERVMAEYLADTPCSVLICDYDHNAPDAKHLEKTHFALYETFRRSQPTTPVLFLSKPDADRGTDTLQRLNVIRNTYERAVGLGDRNVRMIDGYELFGEKNRALCTVDGCHPTDLGFYRMAERIYREIEDWLQ